MRAMQIIEWGKPLEAREYPDPEPKGEEVLLRVEAAGVCQSDVHIWDGYFDLGGERQISLESRGVHLPFTMGHEIAGEVAALGPQASGVKVGDKGGGVPLDRMGAVRRLPLGRGTAVPHPAHPRHVDDHLVIIGAGGVGGSAVHIAPAAVAGRVIVADIDAQKRAQARQMGAVETIDNSAPDAVK